MDEELRLRKLQNPIRYYKPHEKQRRFHESQKRIRLFCGGNRSGKSTAGIAEDLAFALGKSSWQEEDGRDLPECPTKGLIAAPDFINSHKKVIVPKLKELAPKSFFKKIERGQHGVESRFYCTNGSVIDLMSYDQDHMKYEGADYDWAHFDEPPPRDIWIAVRRGLLDRGGRAWFTLTPLREPWIFDEIHSQAGFDDSIDTFQVDIRDNPYLIPEEVDEFEKSLTIDEQEARLHGKWMHLTGLVYKEFSRDVHVVKDFKIPMEWPKGLVVDPHDRKPFAMAWFAVNPKNDIYFYDEWPDEPFHEIRSADWIIDDYAGIVKQKEKSFSDSIRWRIMDPNFGRAIDVRNKLTIAEEFEPHGLYFDTEVDDGIERGHLAVKQTLRYLKDKPISSINKPKLFFLERCWNTIFGMEHYQWDEFVKAESKGFKEKPKQRYKDFPDLVRYTIMFEPYYQPLEMALADEGNRGFSGYGE